mgnify:CR=1 FL=1
MKRFFTTLLSFILVIATMFSLSACSTSDKNTTSNNTSKKATKFVPSKNMTKLVLVTNTHFFDGEYQKVLNQFNLKLADKNIIDDKSFTAAKRNGKIYVVPDILNGTGRGWNVKTSNLFKLIIILSNICIIWQLILLFIGI